MVVRVPRRMGEEAPAVPEQRVRGTTAVSQLALVVAIAPHVFYGQSVKAVLQEVVCIRV